MRLAGPLVQGYAATEREVAFVSVSRAYLLPTEAPVVPGDELLTGSARGATHRAAKHRPDAEVCLQSPSVSGGPQRADVHAKLSSQFDERQSHSSHSWFRIVKNVP